jgi:hypothetical protein
MRQLELLLSNGTFCKRQLPRCLDQCECDWQEEERRAVTGVARVKWTDPWIAIRCELASVTVNVCLHPAPARCFASQDEVSFSLHGSRVYRSGYSFLTGAAYRAIITSDVLVDDVGVSRKLFGRVIQEIRWSELKVIREYSGCVRNAEETLRFVRLVPKAFPFFTFRLCEPMLISDRIDNF